MASSNEAKVKFTAETQEFTNKIKSANSEMSNLRAEMKLSQAQFQNTGDSAEYNQKKLDILSSQIEANKEKQEALTAKLESAKKIYGDNSEEVSKLEKQLTYAKTEEQNLLSQVSKTNDEIADQAEESEKSSTAMGKLTEKIESQESELKDLKSDYANAILQYGETSDEAQSLASEIVELSDDLNKNKSTMKEAESAADSLTDAAEDLGDSTEEAGENAEDAESSFDSWKVALGNLASSAIQECISKVTELAGEIYELGVDTETSFAKLETIAGTENIDDLTESISELAKETGVSSSELADVAYNAISAGSSAEDAMSVVESATKLATAGFTDSSSALSVLSTAMNSYGDSAGTVEEISDSLIMVQNLGVTTIDELSGAMGKAISTGSAYSVDLGNLESAYVSLTKAGISTEEATTYLSSMMNELGDSGSDVSAILQEETGKSFTELMEDGNSLSDVLSILYDSCDGDSTALMNLWSSAEAGKASNAIVNQGLDEFNENLETITNSSGATEDAYSTMADTTETKMAIMKTGFEELGLKIYDGLEGPLGNAITFVTETVIPGLETFMDNASEVFSEVATFVTETLVPAFQDAWDKISEAIGPVVEWFQTDVLPIAEDVFGTIATFFMETLLPTVQEVWDKISSAIGTVVEWFQSDVLPGIQKVMTSVGEAFKAAWDLIKTVWDIVSPYFTTLWNAIKAIFSVVKDVLSGFFSAAWNAIKIVWDVAASFFSTIWDTIAGIFKVVKSVLSGDFQGAWDAIKDVFASFADFFGDLWDAVKKVFDGVKTFFKDVFKKAWDAIKDVFSGVGDFFTGIWEKITGIFGDIGTAIADGISGAVKGAINSVLSTAAGIINGFIGAINTAISIINAIPGVSIDKLSKLEVPQLAEGGVLKKGQVALLEGEGDEAVIPLSQNTEWIGNVAGELAGILSSLTPEIPAGASEQDYASSRAEAAVGDSINSLAAAIEALASRPIQMNINGRSFATATSGDMDSALGTRQTLTARGLSLA